MVGLKFGRWVVVRDTGLKTKSYFKLLECQCECGTVKIIPDNSLKMGMTKSCGCLKRELVKKQFTKHGHENNRGKTRTYTSWDNMIQRCTNPNRQEYRYYGGRGILVCEEWKDFQNFYTDMGERPEGKSLDRIDNNGGYEPANCKWSSRAEQVLNRRPYSQRKDKGIKRKGAKDA